MEQFASGWKQSYYGKGDVIAYRLNRGGIFGVNTKILIYGDAFWPTYTHGDNSNLVATDSMKNFIQRETMNFTGSDLESYCGFIGTKFMNKYPHVEGAQISASEIPYSAVAGQKSSFIPSGPERMTARMEIARHGVVEVASGITGFRMVRLGGSAFAGFIRDEYTTLPDIRNRPLHMWLDMEWLYTSEETAFTDGKLALQIRQTVHETFGAFESGSIQQIIYQIGTKVLEENPTIAEVHLEANNRTWDTIAEKPDEVGVFTDARPPYGCLGLRLRRQG